VCVAGEVEALLLPPGPLPYDPTVAIGATAGRPRSFSTPRSIANAEMIMCTRESCGVILHGGEEERVGRE
jgi:hypothetical protein